MIKNIVFDFGNVIIKWDTKHILKSYDISNEEEKILEKAIFQSEEWLKLDEGLITLEDAEKIFENRLPNGLKATAKEVMKSWFEKIEFNEKVCNLIKNLKKEGYKVYGLSNTNIQFYNYMKNSDIGKYFDGFLISAVEKMMKPNENIYYRLFEKFSLNPEECFFIDDTNENIVASEKCGMKGFTFTINEFEKLENKLQNMGYNNKS